MLYSSSVAPLAHDHYGWPDAPRGLFRPVADADLVELPITIGQVLGRDFVTGAAFPAASGKHHRSRDPPRQSRGRRAGECSISTPGRSTRASRACRTPLKSRLRHYSRLGAMAGKLARLIRRHEWGRVDRVIAREAERLQ
jgi:hypothetical protein